jgi:hypothetical protein
MEDHGQGMNLMTMVGGGGPRTTMGRKNKESLIGHRLNSLTQKREPLVANIREQYKEVKPKSSISK